MLLTHKGISGPGVLRLSAWGARHLAAAGYRCQATVQWCTGDDAPQDITAWLQEQTRSAGKKQLNRHRLEAIPQCLWLALLTQAGIDPSQQWAQLSKAARHQLHIPC